MSIQLREIGQKNQTSSTASGHQACIESVSVRAVWKQKHLPIPESIEPKGFQDRIKRNDSELRVVRQKATDDILVLPFQEGACRVEKPPTRPDQRRVLLKYVSLDSSNGCDLIPRNQQLGARVSAEGTNTGARGIHENCVGPAVELRYRIHISFCRQDQGCRYSRTLETPLHANQSLLINVDRHNGALVPHQCAEMKGLAPTSRTCIDHTLPRSR